MLGSGSVVHRIFGSNYFQILVLACLAISATKVHSLSSPGKLTGDMDLIEAAENQLPYREIAQVTFVSGLRHKRDLASREFHIIEVYRPSINITTVMHLYRKNSIVSSNFKVVVRNGDDAPEEILPEEEDYADCLYHGSIHSNAEGRVAVSACGGHFGFTGLIVDGDEHLIIEPHPHPVNAKSFEEGRIQIPHVIRRPRQMRLPCLSDSLRVSPEELMKSEEMDLLTRHKRDVEEPSDDSEPQQSMTDIGEEYELEGDSGARVTLSENQQDQKPKTQKPQGGKLNGQKPKGSKPRGQIPQGKKPTDSKAKATKPEKKGQAAGSNEKQVIEISVFTDVDFYNKMKDLHPQDTTAKLTHYVLTIVDAMDLLYEQKSLGVNVQFRLVHLEIQTKWPSTMPRQTDASKYLDVFCKFAGGINTDNKKWDHSIMLSGQDLIVDARIDIAGLAFGDTMCYRYYSCSVSEGRDFESSYTLAHEIGHSIGISHDGNPINKYCKDTFIMSPTTGAGKVTWSTCSSSNLKEFIKYGTTDPKRRPSSKAPRCLRDTSQAKSIDYHSSLLPGQAYDAKKQCELAYGKNSKPQISSQKPYNNVCSGLWCCEGVKCKMVHPGLDGTACGNGQHCHLGKCGK